MRTAIVSGAAGSASQASAACLARLGNEVAVLEATANGSIADAVERVCAELDHPTVLVNHVGAGQAGMARLSIADWDDLVTGQLRLVFLTCRAVIDSMVLRGGGRIVTVVEGENSIIRAAVAGFTRTIALELEPFGITANVIEAQVHNDGDLTATLGFLLGAGGVTGQIIRTGA